MYGAEYGKVKASRRLAWIGGGSLGTVDLELDFGEDEPRPFSVTPLQASLILLFQEQGINHPLFFLPPLFVSLLFAFLVLNLPISF